MRTWLNVSQIVIVAAVLILAVVSSIVVAVGGSRPSEPATAVTLSDRIAVLVQSLQDSSTAISEIGEEIQAREELVATLEEKRRTSEEIINLSEAELEAASQLFAQEITARRSFWDTTWGDFTIAFASGSILFVVGIGFNARLLPRITRDSSTSPPSTPL